MAIGERTSSQQIKPHWSVPVHAGLQSFIASVGGCPAIKSKTVKVNCTQKLFMKGIDCTKKVPHGTKATFTCPNNTYMVEKYDTATCGVPTRKKWSNKLVKCRSSDFTSTTISTSSIDTTVSSDASVSDLPSLSDDTTISSDTMISADTTSSSTDLAPTTVLSASSSAQSSTTTAAVTTPNATIATNTIGTTSTVDKSTTTANTANTMAGTTASALSILTPIPGTGTTVATATTTPIAKTVATAATTTTAATVATATTTTTAATVATSTTTTTAAPVTTATTTTTAAPVTTATTTTTAAPVTTPITTTTAATMFDVCTNTTIIATTSATTTRPIPPGYVHVTCVGYVKPSTAPKIFYDAKADCAKDGATLIVISTAQKFNYISSIVNNSNFFAGAYNDVDTWVGLENVSSVWRTPQGVDVKSIAAFKWSPGRPLAGYQCGSFSRYDYTHWDFMYSCQSDSTKYAPYICDLNI